MGDLLHPRQVAERYGITPETLSNMRAQGKGPPFVRLSSKRVMYRLADVLQWEAARTVQPATGAAK